MTQPAMLRRKHAIKLESEKRVNFKARFTLLDASISAKRDHFEIICFYYVFAID